MFRAPLFLFLICTVFFGISVVAEESSFANKNGLQIGGYFDLYYLYNFNKPAPVTSPDASHPAMPAPNNQYRVFDIYHDNIDVALAEVTLQKKQDDVTFSIALDFGHNADVLSPNDEVSKHITQAYLSYQPHQLPQLTLVAGKMLTHMGLEVPRAKDNWNYSRSLLFGYAFPFWHTGVGAKYAFLDGKLTAAAYLYNNTQGLYATNRSKTIGAQLQYAPNQDLTLTYNFLSGPEADASGNTRTRAVHELIGKYQIAENWAIAADGAFGTLRRFYADGRPGTWLSGFVALKWTNGFFSLSPRFEMYVDKSGATIQVAGINTTAVPQRIDSETLTASFACGKGLETRLEFRHDHSTADVFSNGNGRLLNSQSTVTSALLYEF